MSAVRRIWTRCPAPLRRWLRGLPGFARVRAGLLFLLDPRWRSEWLLLRRSPAGLFQPLGDTAEDRYPRIFEAVREGLREVPEARLLSFGCATGEEVFSLRRYFPRAAITGLDINPRAIAVCQRRQRRSGDIGLRFRVAASTAAEPAQAYDAIFCMAVLRHGCLGEVRPQCCEPWIRFGDFEQTVADLARCLRPGGLLAITHANFRFRDTPTAAGFDVVLSWKQDRQPEATPLFGPDDTFLGEVPYNEVLFRKKPEFTACQGPVAGIHPGIGPAGTPGSLITDDHAPGLQGHGCLGV
ncbi:MAG: class I SAM-dependent methyltransferase [Alphaproteobacteria bacterium]